MTQPTENMNYKEIARNVVQILQGGHLFDVPHPKPHHDNCPDVPHPLHRKPKPILPLHGEIHHRQRVTLEPEALAEALNQRGLASAMHSLETAPAEVKIIVSLLLNMPIVFSGETQPRRERAGFENPFLAGKRFDDLADRLNVDSEQFHAELEGAPAEMLGIIMILVDDVESHVARKGVSDGTDCPNRIDNQGV